MPDSNTDNSTILMVSLKNAQDEIGTLLQLTHIGNFGFEESNHGRMPIENLKCGAFTKEKTRLRRVSEVQDFGQTTRYT